MLERMKPVRPFIEGEDGAVTVDWVVLAAAVAFLSIPILVAVNTAVENGTQGIAADVEAAADR